MGAPAGAEFISVAMCTRNGAEFVSAQVRSILGQSRPVQQIVVSDDASSDSTLEIVRREVDQAESRPQLTILRNKVALGVTANFEQALAACTGELFVLCDQDDVWRPDRIESALRVMRARPDVVLTHSDARLVDSTGHPLGLTLMEALELRDAVTEIRDGRSFTALLRRNLATGATMMMRPELFDTARPFPREWLHDEWLAMIASVIGRIGVIEEPLIDYRQHGANVVGVGVPTLRSKVDRVLAPRGQRSVGLVARAAVLLRWLEERPYFDPRFYFLAREKFLHERYRMDLKTRRLQRLLPIYAEIRSGRYDLYSSRGRFDVVRDALQPH